MASHDLQEPLRSIVAFSQLLARRYRGRLDADADEFIGFIVEGGNRMQALIHGPARLLARDCDAGGAPRPSMRRRRSPRRLPGSTASIRETGTIVTHDPLPAVIGRPDAARAGLLEPGRKRDQVPPAGRAAAGPRRAPGGRTGSGSSRCADNGIGIAPEYFDRIFVIFQRLHTKEMYEGTGIGLAVVKRIVERHGGRIRVESTPGEGSTFFFTLPAA